MTALLVLDLETTGLTSDSTILECAWTVCDLDGTMRIPLRSRFCSIAFGKPLVPLRRSPTRQPIWDEVHVDRVDEVALRMAVDSGLFDEWLACPEPHRLKSAAEPERLILDDLAVTCHPGETVHLGGSGVAQFDHALLRMYCPRVVFPQGKPGGPVHYRPVDQSVTLTTLIGESSTASTTALIARYLQRNGGADVAVGMHPQYAYGDHATIAWLTGDRGAHRAAPDVARAVVAQRALWAYGQSLRNDLGITP